MRFRVIALMGLLAILIGGCTPPATPQPTVQTVVIPNEPNRVIVTVVATDESQVQPETSHAFVTGIFEEPATMSTWAHLAEPDVWTGYVLSDQYGSLYKLGEQRFDWVPYLAETFPPERVQEGKVTTITVRLLDGLTWSDEEPLTARDVAFTINTIMALELGGEWATYRPESLERVEAVDGLTVKFTFTEPPTLAEFEYGVALMPIMPLHYWQPIARDAIRAYEALPEPPSIPGNGASEEQIEAYGENLLAYQEEIDDTHAILLEADALPSPVFGPFRVVAYEQGAFVQKEAVEEYVFTGLTMTLYDDGTYAAERPNGTTFLAYGTMEGAIMLEVTTGPYIEEVVYLIYARQDEAFFALEKGEVDYVFSPLTLSEGQREQVESAAGLTITENPRSGYRYMAFNTRKAPFNDVAFRQAVATVVDTRYIAVEVADDYYFPMYSIVPEGVGFWYNSDMTRWGWEGGEPLGQKLRFEAAKQILIDAGYRWTEAPVWDDQEKKVIRGSVLLQPNGTPVPEFELLAPSPGWNPARATAVVLIEEYMQDIGIPAIVRFVPFSVISPAIYAEGGEALKWDMYISGWSFGEGMPTYLHAFFATESDSATGGFNTSGYANPEFDALAADFLTTTDIEEAQRLAAEMQALLAEEVPVVVLFTNPVLEAYRDTLAFPYTDVLGGIQGQNGLIDFVRVFMD